MEELDVIIKPGNELDSDEIKQTNNAKFREFQASPMSQNQIDQSIFFLLEDSSHQLLALGQLVLIKPVYFNNEEFEIYGIGGIIANFKGLGYGKKIMVAIRDYLIKINKSGVGFTGGGTYFFYQKSGFEVDKNAIKRFVFLDNGQKIINQESTYVLYLDSTDHFMRKVLANLKLDVILPREPDW